MQNPRESHWKAAKRILRYVRGTVQFGIHYSAKETPLLVGFTDSDWVGDPDYRKSTAGYVFTLGSGPITWACKKQAAISLSSQKQSIVVPWKLVRKPCGFVRSYQNLALSSSIRLHFGVIIKVPFSFAKIQFSINAANTLNYTCTSLESSFMTMFLKCNIIQQMIKL